MIRVITLVLLVSLSGISFAENKTIIPQPALPLGMSTGSVSSPQLFVRAEPIPEQVEFNGVMMTEEQKVCIFGSDETQALIKKMEDQFYKLDEARQKQIYAIQSLTSWNSDEKYSDTLSKGKSNVAFFELNMRETRANIDTVKSAILFKCLSNK